jgi:hypothetical protein
MNRRVRPPPMALLGLLVGLVAVPALSTDLPSVLPATDRAAEPPPTEPPADAIQARGLNPVVAAPSATLAPAVIPRPIVVPVVQPVLAPVPLPSPAPVALPSGGVPVGVVPPGSVQPVLPLAPIPTGAGPPLQVWVFANPTAHALSPTSAEVDWAVREGATLYRVWRDGVAIADVDPQSPSQRFVDAALAPGRGYSYKVWAMQSLHRPRDAKDRTGGLLEESNATFVATPAAPVLAAPTNVTANIVLTVPRSSVVHLSWSAAAGAAAYRVFRDGQIIQLGTAGVMADDSSVADGTHLYVVQSLYSGFGNTQVLGPFSSAVTIRTGPFIAIALGDSIMWGQGLSDATGSHKFTSRVRDWVGSSLVKPATLTSFAHSGADLNLPVGEPRRDPTLGEVPNSFPTVWEQLAMAVASLSTPPPGATPTSPDDVDLVLVDGCTNDIGIRTILNPLVTETAIAANATALCSGMADFLTAVHGTFKNAKIIVTGYFPIVSPVSDLTALGTLLADVGIVIAPAAAASLGIPLDPVSGAIAGFIVSEYLRKSLVSHSAIYAASTTSALATAVSIANAKAGGGWSTFVAPPFQDVNAYAAPATWLWLVPTGLFPKDEVFDERSKMCSAVTFLDASQPALCVEASMGHPNVLGAQAYADAITAQLAAVLPVWSLRHATVQHAP